jgi:hypothetical protein
MHEACLHRNVDFWPFTVSPIDHQRSSFVLRYVNQPIDRRRFVHEDVSAKFF